MIFKQKGSFINKQCGASNTILLFASGVKNREQERDNPISEHTHSIQREMFNVLKQNTQQF